MRFERNLNLKLLYRRLFGPRRSKLGRLKSNFYAKNFTQLDQVAVEICVAA